MSDIPKKLKELRVNAGYTQKQLAEKMNVSQTAIALWENGSREPSFDTIKEIAEIFGVMPASIIGFDEEFIELLEIYAKETARTNHKSQSTGKITNPLDDKTCKINKLFDQLNNTGQDKAIEQVELLTKIPEYQKEPEE